MTIPASPLAAPMRLAANYATPLSGKAIADRVDMLNQQGHEWMPDDMKTTLAASPSSDSEMVTAAHTIKSHLSQVWDGFTEAFDDPVLHKEPTKALTLSRLINASLGPIPVEEMDLTTIQKDLQRLGFGKDLDANGVWGADWNGAYNDYAHHVTNVQMAGGRPLSVTTGKAVHHWYEDFTPSHAFNAIVGFAKSLPGDVRSIAADFSSGVTNLAIDAKNLVTDPVGTLGDIHWGTQHDAAARAGAAVENIGRDRKISAEQYERMAQNPGRLLQDVGTVLAIVPVVGQASKAYQVSAKVLAEGAAKDAAVRGPGVIAQSFGGLTSKEIVRATEQGLDRDVLRQGGVHKMLGTRVFTNVPLLRQVGPVVGRLADADGFYYRSRTLLAAPYKYAPVQIAGDIGQRVMVTGGLLNVGADVAQHFGAGSQLTHDILDTEATDLIDRNLQRIIGTPLEHPFTDAINALGFVLHGPLGAAENSTRIGDTVQAAVDATGDALGRVGLLGIYQRAVQTAHDLRTLPSVAALAKEFGGQEYLERFIALKTADLAAAHYAQKGAQAEGLSFGGETAAQYKQRVGELADEIWADPAKHTGAIRELIAQEGGVGLINRFAADMIHAAGNPKEYVSDAIAWMRSGDHLMNALRNGEGKYLFGGQGRALIESAQDEFDFGLGMGSNLFRAGGGLTRREYNREVSALMGRIRSGIDGARRQAARALSEAQADLDAKKAAIAGRKTTDEGFTEARVAVRKAQGRVQSAKIRQRRIEEALQSNLTHQLERTLAGLRGPRGSEAEWSRVASDVKRLRTLVQPAYPQGEKFRLADALEQGVDPDVLYTRMNGAPRPPDHDIGTGDWLREHFPHANGALGIGRIDTKSVQAATNDLNAFELRLQQAAQDPEQYAAVVEELKHYGFAEFGMDERSLGVFDDNAEALLNTLRERSKDLASDVFLTPDAPKSLRDAVKAMSDLGYKPMLGSHIGHAWDGSLPPLGDIDGAVTKRRRLAGVLGLDTTQITSRTAGQNARIRILNEMQRAIHEDKRIVLPPRVTAETVLAVLQDAGLYTPELKAPERVAYFLSRPLHKKVIEQVAADKGVSLAEAAKIHETELARAMQVRDIPREEAIRVLTTDGEGETASGATWHWQGMDKRSAHLLWQAAQRGYAGRPNYIMGLQGIEDFARGGMWIGNKLAVQFPDSGAIQKLANLPNELVLLRNRGRFTLSPFFDLRRVTKTNYKMGVDGVVPVLNPFAHLMERKEYQQASELLARLLGETNTAGFDEADRYLHAQSVWGGYNARHFEAYYAWQKHLQGATDDEIRHGLHRVFEYGSSRSGGRSALERSVNTIYFPFSFEKTLIRNTGMYLLDHPQQALLLTGAMEAYRQANEHDAISQWVDDHLPILQDVEKLNAFAHGISLGERGGINAPLMNLFLPQVWEGKNYTEANLKRFLPIWSDFGHLMSDVQQQTQIAYNTGRNAIDYSISLGKPRSFLDPYRPMETDRAQQRDASAAKARLISALTGVLDENYGRVAEDKIRWPDDPSLPPGVQGQPVDRTSIGYLVKRWYPAYDPQHSAEYAQEQAREGALAIAKIAQTNPQRAQEIGVLQKLADSFVSKVNRDEYDTTETNSITTLFRTIAVQAAEHDSDFYKYYRAHFAWIFGPLERIQEVD